MGVRRIGVDIFQPIVPEYRRALFEGLENSSELSISVQASTAFNAGDVSVEMNVATYNKKIRLISFFDGRVVWQSGFYFKKALNVGDVVVICGDIHQFSSLWMAAKAKLKGLGVVWWGHHQSMNARPLFVKLRLFVAKLLSDCMLCYTDEGIKMLVAHGFDSQSVFATGNTVDTDNIKKEISKWTADKLTKFKYQHDLEGKRVLMYCGVLRKKVRLDIVLKALKAVAGRFSNTLLVVIGDGEMLEEYRVLGHKLDLSNNIMWLGEIRRQADLAPWFLSSELFVYGGAVGLSLIHALAYGLPAVLHSDPLRHMPEFEAMDPGVNGLTFLSGDSNDMAEKIIKLFSEQTMLLEMRINAIKTVEERYSIESMIARFNEAVQRASQLSLDRAAKRG